MAATAPLGRAIDLELFIKAPPERVFAAFTEKTALESWFAQRADVDPTPGGAFGFFWLKEHVNGRYLEIDPPTRLVLEFDERPAADGVTVMTVTLTPVAGGTRLHFYQTGFHDGPDWDALYDGMSSGWPSAFADLAYLLETGTPRDGGFRTQ